MKRAKDFDCVQMKNEIQARLLQEYHGLTDAEIQARIEQELATSSAPAAQFWRRIAGTPALPKVAEAPAKYRARQRKTS